MIGVVLFKNTRSGRVIFWCEENQDLVHFSEKAEIAQGGPLEVADVVSFEICESEDGLWAHEVSKTDDTWGRALVDQIKRFTSAPDPEVVHADNVVSLRTEIPENIEQIGRLGRNRNS